jgi:hypothetical protein
MKRFLAFFFTPLSLVIMGNITLQASTQTEVLNLQEMLNTSQHFLFQRVSSDEQVLAYWNHSLAMAQKAEELLSKPDLKTDIPTIDERVIKYLNALPLMKIIIEQDFLTEESTFFPLYDDYVKTGWLLEGTFSVSSISKEKILYGFLEFDPLLSDGWVSIFGFCSLDMPQIEKPLLFKDLFDIAKTHQKKNCVVFPWTPDKEVPESITPEEYIASVKKAFENKKEITSFQGFICDEFNHSSLQLDSSLVHDCLKTWHRDKEQEARDESFQTEEPAPSKKLFLRTEK